MVSTTWIEFLCSFALILVPVCACHRGLAAWPLGKYVQDGWKVSGSPLVACKDPDLRTGCWPYFTITSPSGRDGCPIPPVISNTLTVSRTLIEIWSHPASCHSFWSFPGRNEQLRRMIQTVQPAIVHNNSTEVTLLCDVGIVAFGAGMQISLDCWGPLNGW